MKGETALQKSKSKMYPRSATGGKTESISLSSRDSGVYSQLRDLKSIFGIMGARPAHIIIPVFLSLLISLFGGISVGLLVPIAKGISSNDFGFIEQVPVFRSIMTIFPGMFAAAHIRDRSIFMLLVSIIFIASIFKNALTYLNTLVSAYMNGRYTANMNTFIFNRYLSFGKMFFDRTSQSYLSTVLNYSVKILKLLNSLQVAVREFFAIAVYLTIMCMISYKLTVFTLIIFPLLHYSLKWIIRGLEETTKLTTEIHLRLKKNVFNILSCVPLIKAYTREDDVKEQYASMTEMLRQMSFKASRIRGLSGPIQEIIILMTLLAMITVVTFLFVEGQVAQISIFIVFLYVVQKTLPMFRVFNNVKIALVQALPRTRKVLKILDDKGKFYVAEGNREFDGLREGIEIDRLNFCYTEERPVINDLSLSIEKGKTMAIVGPSGAGKTTVISLILRFYDCPPSAIRVDGTDIREFTLKSLRTHMALVSQDMWLFDDTLRNNIVFGFDGKITDRMLEDALKKAQLHEFVTGLPEGLDTYVGDRGIKLSGGEKQRVALARAFLKGAEVLILDEATSSLDTKAERLIQQAIDEVVRERTAIIIAHRLSTVKRADKIAVIDDGRLIEEGSLDDLLGKKGRFYQYWKEQQFF